MLCNFFLNVLGLATFDILWEDVPFLAADVVKVGCVCLQGLQVPLVCKHLSKDSYVIHIAVFHQLLGHRYSMRFFIKCNLIRQNVVRTAL